MVVLTHSGIDIPSSVGQSLYDGIPSNGIMLYGDDATGDSFYNPTGYSSSNPLGIQGDSINLMAPLSSCPNGIKIHFGTSVYLYDGTLSQNINITIPDICIPKGSSSGASTILSQDGEVNGSNITASINGLTLSFSVNNSNKN